MDSVCRLCSNQTSSLKSIFSFENGRGISDLITILIPIQIDYEDSLPKNICTECLEILQKCHDLRDKSVKSDLFFRSGSFVAVLERQPPDPTDFMKIEMTEDSIKVEDSIRNCETSCDDFAKCDPLPDCDKEEAVKNADSDTSMKSEKRFSCPIRQCQQTFSHSTNVRRHVARAHDESQPFECEICAYRFKSSRRLDGHRLNFHSSKKKCTDEKVKLRCEICNEEILKQDMRVHLKTHGLDFFVITDDGDIKCSACPQKFTMKNNARHHFLNAHSKDLLFPCDLCTFRFKTESKLKNHMLQVHEPRFSVEIPNRDEEDVSDCNFCGQKFEGSRLRLERHLLLSHKPDLLGLLQCHLCDREFAFGKSLHRHILVHRKEKRNESALRCDFCTKKFLSKVKLLKHL